MFLITGCGRCGTTYAAKFFRRLGLRVSHEHKAKGMCRERKWEVEGFDGISDWHEVPHASHYDQVFHQVRTPLKALGSMTTIKPFSWVYIDEKLRKKGIRLRRPYRRHRLYNAMVYYVHWNTWAAVHSLFTYRVEDLPDRCPEILYVIDRTDLVGKIGRAKGAPKRGNSRRCKYTTPTWKKLKKQDSSLAKKIWKMAKGYGYKVA